MNRGTPFDHFLAGLLFGSLALWVAYETIRALARGVGRWADRRCLQAVDNALAGEWDEHCTTAGITDVLPIYEQTRRAVDFELWHRELAGGDA